MKQASLLLIAAFAVTTTIACGDKKEDKGGGKAGTSKAGEAKPGAKKGGGGAIDEVRGAALAETAIPGYKQQSKTVRKSMVNLFYVSENPNAQGKNVSIMAILQPCMMCQPLDLAKWKANENLKMMLPKIHKENPQLVWEVEALEEGGHKGIYTYSLSFHQSEDGKSRSSSHTITLYTHNGTNMMTATISGKGVWAKSLEELKTQVTKDELVAAAKVALTTFAPKL